MGCLSIEVNPIVADDLVMQGARASAAISIGIFWFQYTEWGLNKMAAILHIYHWLLVEQSNVQNNSIT